MEPRVTVTPRRCAVPKSVPRLHDALLSYFLDLLTCFVSCLHIFEGTPASFASLRRPQRPATRRPIPSAAAPPAPRMTENSVVGSDWHVMDPVVAPLSRSSAPTQPPHRTSKIPATASCRPRNAPCSPRCSSRSTTLSHVVTPPVRSLCVPSHALLTAHRSLGALKRMEGAIKLLPQAPSRTFLPLLHQVVHRAIRGLTDVCIVRLHLTVSL